MNAKFLVAAAMAVASVTTLGATGALASTASPHSTPPSTHAPEIRGFKPAVGIHIPAGRLPHLIPNGALTSANWSGYAAAGYKNVALRYVSAAWSVPSLSSARCVPGTSGYAYATHWVGLDGFGSRTVEEIGTGAYCQSSGTVSYFAFYDMVPAAPVVYTTGIGPGDAITASVYYNASSHDYNLVLTDVTAASQINVNATCPSGSVCGNVSAEVISEVTGGGPPTVNLADFGMVNDTGANVTSRSGLRGTLGTSSLWSSSQIYMVDSSGHLMAAPSPLYGGQAFNVTWIGPS
jgi:hypothetical protein